MRIYKLYWSYARGKDTARKSAYEVMRIFVRSDDGKKAIVEPYYYDSVTHWRRGYHPGALFGMECFISEEPARYIFQGLKRPCKVRIGNTVLCANSMSGQLSRCRSATI